MAAQGAIQKFKDQLNCPVCLDTYTDPKELQCFHVYCRGCLVKLVERDKEGRLVLPCPTCRQLTPVPERGVAGLQSAFNITPFLEIKECIDQHPIDHIKRVVCGKKSKGDNTSRNDLTKGSDIKMASPEKDGGNVATSDEDDCCWEHGGKELELYCETCQKLICCKCAIKGCSHFGHDYAELGMAVERFGRELAQLLEPMEEQTVAIGEALARLDAHCTEIYDRRTDVETDIHHSFQQLQEVLETRKTELISQLHTITQRKLKQLATQRDQIETTQTRLNSCLSLMRERSQHMQEPGQEKQVLKMKAVMLQRVKDVTASHQPDMLEPNTIADMTFSTLKDLDEEWRKFGRVSTLGRLDPTKCHTTGKGLETAIVGETPTADLEVMNSDGEPYTEPIPSSSEYTLVSELTGTTERGGIVREALNRYTASFQPTVKGRHQLHIRVDGQHIRGSPFSVSVSSPLEELGTPLLTISHVQKPIGVALSKNGELIVTEYDGHQISVFTPAGKKLRSFGQHGTGQGQFRHPRGVAMDAEGNILVVDSLNHRLQKFTPKGSFLAQVGVEGSGHTRYEPLHFNWPKDVAVSPTSGRIYVVDYNHRVQVLNPDLSYFGTFGRRGHGPNELLNPCGVACDSSGCVYVADTGNCCVKVFTAEGRFLKMFGGCGKGGGGGGGGVGCPHTIAVGGEGTVYLSEFEGHRVSAFSPTCRHLTSFGGRGAGLGELDQPMGLAVDQCGVLYVCDYNNCRIQVF